MLDVLPKNAQMLVLLPKTPNFNGCADNVHLEAFK